jgi:hypothetical protein
MLRVIYRKDAHMSHECQCNPWGAKSDKMLLKHNLPILTSSSHLLLYPLEFCTIIYCVKVSLVKPTVNSGSRGLVQNLFYKFWTFLQVSTNFGSLN